MPFQIDHVIARKHGGDAADLNLALACFSCNVYKGSNIAGIDPISKTIVRLFHPRHERWNDHFKWKQGSIVGKSAIARATIDVLRLNLPLRVEHRQLLITARLFH